MLFGTRWVIKESVETNSLFKVIASQRGSDNIRDRDTCLVGVKMKGSSLIIFKVQIILKIVTNNTIILVWDFFRFVIRSFFIIELIFFTMNSKRFFILFKGFIKNKPGKNKDSQFNLKKLVDGSNIINRLVIMCTV